MQNKTVYLNAYQPPVFAVETVHLDIDLYDDHALINNTMSLVRCHPGPVALAGDALVLVDLLLNGESLAKQDYHYDGDYLIIPTLLNQLNLTVITRIEPQNNTALSGLYRSNALFCTQCEAEGFRRITYFPDRPDVLSVYTTRISADKQQYPILLSNGNCMDAGELDHGRHWVLWHDPFKKPCYLFALVAGNLACVEDKFKTCSGRTVDLKIYVEPGNEDKCAHAMHALKKAMHWDEEEYGREYDLDLFMIVAVSDFNMGAMENKGLNIFNAKYILARPDTATDQDYADIEGVVAHEYFHNWTGNRVTCRDWFQLSLKEGLTVFRDQEFSCDMNSRDVNRINDVNLLRQTQFPEDAGKMAHPVRPESYQEINNFYTATIYNKGAEVIRMQETLLGKVGFRKGMDLYFERHDGQAVTIDDFVAAMQDANQYDLTQFMRWYSQAGTPRVSVIDEVYDAGKFKITFTQTCPITADGEEKQPFVIPIRYTLFDKYGEPLSPKPKVFILQESEQSLEIDGLKDEPSISLLQDFSAPIILERQLSTKAWLSLLRYETNGFAKWDIAQRLAQQAILTCYHAPRDAWHLDESLLLAYQDILNDETLDPALRAELLTPPGFEILISMTPNTDVALLEDARDFFRKTLSHFLSADASELYARLWKIEDHTMQGVAYSRRRLRHTCLWLMMKSGHQSALAWCEQQFVAAQTMTDQLGSFALLVNSEFHDARAAAIQQFHHQWQQEELVMDKWFSIQATCELPGTLNAVKILMNHPLFSMTNPNRARSLLGAFVQGNPRNFHAIDGSGYEFLKEQLLIMDKINPQVAARLATPFTRWQRVDSARQLLIQTQLKQLSDAVLSSDVRELVNKSLV